METVADVSTATFRAGDGDECLAARRASSSDSGPGAANGHHRRHVLRTGQHLNNTRVTGWEIYRASKSALNQLMRSYARVIPTTRAPCC